MRRLARRLILATIVLVAGIVLLGFSLYRASQQVPDFYRQALAASEDARTDQAEQFERQALALHNQLQNDRRWQVRFTQEEINGWLATELPAKFPSVLPEGVSEPRVAIDDDSIQLALQYQRGDLTTVVSVSGQIQLTDQPNEITVRISRVRAGALPLPLGEFLAQITERAGQAGVPLRWTEAGGDPVAIVRLPLAADEPDERQLVLDELRLHKGELIVAGHTYQPSLAEATVAAEEEMEQTAAQSSAESTARQR